MRRPLDTRTFKTPTEGQRADSAKRMNTVHANTGIREINGITEQTGEEMPGKKEASGVWVLLVFVVLLAAVVMLAVATQ